MNNTINYGKHNSSYFNMPAAFAVLVAYLLPGVLGMIYSGFSYFASLILIVVAVFEKRSEMVRFYCFQFCFLSMFFNIILSVLSIVSTFLPFFQLLQVGVSLVSAAVVLVCTIYSFVCAFQYKAWMIPYVGQLVLNVFVRK